MAKIETLLKLMKNENDALEILEKASGCVKCYGGRRIQFEKTRGTLSFGTLVKTLKRKNIDISKNSLLAHRILILDSEADLKLAKSSAFTKVCTCIRQFFGHASCSKTKVLNNLTIKIKAEGRKDLSTTEKNHIYREIEEIAEKASRNIIQLTHSSDSTKKSSLLLRNFFAKHDWNKFVVSHVFSLFYPADIELIISTIFPNNKPLSKALNEMRKAQAAILNPPTKNVEDKKDLEKDAEVQEPSENPATPEIPEISSHVLYITGLLHIESDNANKFNNALESFGEALHKKHNIADAMTAESIEKQQEIEYIQAECAIWSIYEKFKEEAARDSTAPEIMSKALEILGDHFFKYNGTKSIEYFNIMLVNPVVEFAKESLRNAFGQIILLKASADKDVGIKAKEVLKSYYSKRIEAVAHFTEILNNNDLTKDFKSKREAFNNLRGFATVKQSDEDHAFTHAHEALMTFYGVRKAKVAHFSKILLNPEIILEARMSPLKEIESYAAEKISDEDTAYSDANVSLDAFYEPRRQTVEDLSGKLDDDSIDLESKKTYVIALEKIANHQISISDNPFYGANAALFQFYSANGKSLPDAGKKLKEHGKKSLVYFQSMAAKEDNFLNQFTYAEMNNPSSEMFIGLTDDESEEEALDNMIFIANENYKKVILFRQPNGIWDKETTEAMQIQLEGLQQLAYTQLFNMAKEKTIKMKDFLSLFPRSKDKNSAEWKYVLNLFSEKDLVEMIMLLQTGESPVSKANIRAAQILSIFEDTENAVG